MRDARLHEPTTARYRNNGLTAPGSVTSSRQERRRLQGFRAAVTRKGVWLRGVVFFLSFFSLAVPHQVSKAPQALADRVLKGALDCEEGPPLWQKSLV